MKEVFPEPLWPINAIFSPGLTERLIESKALIYDLFLLFLNAPPVTDLISFFFKLKSVEENNGISKVTLSNSIIGFSELIL